MPRLKKQHLKRRSDGRYCCKRDGIQFMGNTEEEAFSARERYDKSKKTGSLCNPLTVHEYALQWLPRSYPTVSDSTYTGLAIHLEHLTKAIGNKPLSAVKPSDIKNVYSTAYNGLSNSYILGASQLYRSFFDSAVADGYCASNPARQTKPHKGTVGGHRAITDQERTWIETLCTDHRAYPAVMLMLYAGLRPQEMKAFNVDRDVNFDEDTITLHEFAHKNGQKYAFTGTGKTDKAKRTMPLFPPLKAALKGKHGYIATNADGSQITIQGWKCLYKSYVGHMETAINGISKRWYRRTKEQQKLAASRQLPAWIPFTVVPYDLRHSFATFLRDNGVEINTAISWMGHADAKMILKVYDQVSSDRSKKEAEKLLKSAFRMQNGMQKQNDEPQTLDNK